MTAKDHDYKIFRQTLSAALLAMPSDYIMLPVAGQVDGIYRERVFCYELYHQMQMAWKAGFRYRLAGEVDKKAHPIIEGACIPDFLVHRPGTMGDNLAVMEVKSPKADTEGIRKDLDTLVAFITKADYRYGLLLVYSVDDALATKLKRTIRGSTTSQVSIAFDTLGEHLLATMTKAQ